MNDVLSIAWHAIRLRNRKKKKLNHMMTETLSEKIIKIKEEAFISRINEVFKDPKVAAEQRKMAEDIADNTKVEELPW